MCRRCDAPQAEYHVASALLDILSNTAQSHITVARSDVPGCAYELHPFPDAALKATQTIGRMFRSSFVQLPTKRSIRLYQLLLASASNADVLVRLAAIRTLRTFRADSKYVAGSQSLLVWMFSCACACMCQGGVCMRMDLFACGGVRHWNCTDL